MRYIFDLHLSVTVVAALLFVGGEPARCAEPGPRSADEILQGVLTPAGLLRTARLATQAQGGRHKNDPRLETIARNYDLVLMSSNVYVRPPEILKKINPDIVVFGYVNSSDESPDAEGYVGHEKRLGQERGDSLRSRAGARSRVPRLRPPAHGRRVDAPRAVGPTASRRPFKG